MSKKEEAEFFRSQEIKEFEMSPELKKKFKEEAEKFKVSDDPSKTKLSEVGARKWGFNRFQDVLVQTNLSPKELSESTESCKKKILRKSIDKAQDIAYKDCRDKYNATKFGRDTSETKVCKIEVRKGVALAKKDIQD